MRSAGFLRTSVFGIAWKTDVFRVDVGRRKIAQSTQRTRLEMLLRTLSHAGFPLRLLGRKDQRLASRLIRKGFARTGPSRVWSIDTCRLTAAGRRLRRHVERKASQNVPR